MKKNIIMLSLSCLIVVFFAFLQPLKAQDRYTFEQGLSKLPHQMEGNIIRDSEGFLWFCYYGGIGRYDGFEVKYYNSNDNTVSGPDARSIAIDRDGDLWILTRENGLNKYSKKTDSFTHYTNNLNNQNSLSSNITNELSPQNLLVDNKNRIIIGTSAGIDIYDKKRNTFTHWSQSELSSNSLKGNNITSIIQDRSGVFWIGTVDGGLNRYNEDRDEWSTVFLDTENIKILSLLEDENNIWIGTESHGLYKYNQKSHAVKNYRFDPEEQKSLGDNNIYYLYKDSKNNIWITHKGSSVSGVEMYDRKSDSFIRYASASWDSSNLSSNFVSTVYEDPVSKIFWVVHTLDGVLDKYDIYNRKIESHYKNPIDNNSLSDSDVLVISEDAQNRIWISVKNAINIYNKKNGTYSHLLNKDIDPSMGPFTTAMSWKNNKDLWLLSSRGVLTLFDTVNMTILKQYKNNPSNANTIAASDYTGGKIIKDKDNPDVIWIALSSGLDRFDIEKEIFTHFSHEQDNENSLTPGNVWSVYDDGKGYLWISTFNGLNRLNKSNNQIKRYVNDPNDSESIGFNRTSSVFEDSLGNLWITGFTHGMDMLERKTGKFTHFNTNTGFPSIGINQTIQEDSSENLWIGTTGNGLLKFNIKEKQVIAVYSKSDGFLNNNFRRSYKSSDGKMWFSGEFGLNSFYPGEVNKNNNMPPVFLTSFTQKNIPLELGTAPENLKEITLNWKDNFFEFQFSVLNYTNSDKNRYAYMLEGRDREWFYSDNAPSGRYSALNGGTYTLRLKGSNNDGIWNTDGYSLKIKVTQPFWKSNWFYLLLIVLGLILLAIVLLYLRRLQFEISERKLVEKAFRESEEKYRLLIENAPDIRYRTDKDGYIVFISQSCYRISGYTVEESLGTNADDGLYFNPEERKIFLSELNKKGSVTSYEAKLHKKDGSIWWSSTDAYFYKDKSGNILGVEGVTRDITPKKIMEIELQKFKNYLTNIIDSMPSILVGVDAEGVVTLWNKKAEQTTEISSIEAQGKPLKNVFPAMAEEMETIKKSIHDKQTKLAQKKKRIEQKRTLFEDVTIYPLITNGVEGAVIRIDDVTDQVLMQEMIIQSEKMLSVGGLAAGMAHEINNPLAGMLQTSNVMANRLDPDKKVPANEKAAQIAGTTMDSIGKYMAQRDIPSMIKKINESGQRVAEIVNNMLSFARKSENIFSTHDMSHLIDKTLALAETDYDLKKNFDFKQISIIREYGENLQPVPCESAKMQQVFLNLFRNSAQAMQDANIKDPRIIIRLYIEKNENKLTIEIEDNGPGIKDEIKNKIFEPFFTTKPVGVGTGLGLSVSYFIITEIHSGELFVESSENTGTLFIIKLPIKN